MGESGGAKGCWKVSFSCIKREVEKKPGRRGATKHNSNKRRRQGRRTWRGKGEGEEVNLIKRNKPL